MKLSISLTLLAVAAGAGFTCDRSHNFIKGQSYSQLSLTDGCSAAKPKFDQLCASGVQGRQKKWGYVCCPKECGQCGGSGCSARGGASQCCGGAINKAKKSCSANAVSPSGCIVTNADVARGVAKPVVVCDANPKYGNGGKTDQNKAEAFCKAACLKRSGCTGFFFQKHNNGHEICGFYSSTVNKANAVGHGHKYGAVCTKIVDPFTCDRSKNFIKGQRYSQISLTDGCRAGKCDSNPKYGNGGKTDQNKAEAFCKATCLKRSGCSGFFFQKHNNGHEICGFYGSRINMANAVGHGHKYGAVCTMKWKTCTHMACRVQAGKHCALQTHPGQKKHRCGANGPHLDEAHHRAFPNFQSSAKYLPPRIVVTHKGTEQHGTEHKCFNKNNKCSCLCRKGY